MFKNKNKKIKTLIKHRTYLLGTDILIEESFISVFKDGTVIRGIDNSIYDYSQLISDEAVFNDYATFLFENKTIFDNNNQTLKN